MLVDVQQAPVGRKQRGRALWPSVWSEGGRGRSGRKPRERLITMWPMTDDAVASRTYPRFGRPPSRFLPLFNNPLAADAVLLRRPLLTATHGERRGQCRSPPSFPFPPPFFSSLRRVFSPPPPGPDQSLRYVLVFPISLFLLPSAHFHHPPSTVPAFTSQAHRPCPSNVSSTLVILSLLVFSIIASARIPLAPNRDRPSRERPRPLQLLQEHRLHGHGYAL